MKQAPARGPISPSTIEAIRHTLKISQEGLARILGISLRTVVRWEKEGDAPPALERERLDLIHEVVTIATDIMEAEDVSTWFSTPHASLSGRRPLDLLSSFRGIQQIREILEQTRWGIF